MNAIRAAAAAPIKVVFRVLALSSLMDVTGRFDLTRDRTVCAAGSTDRRTLKVLAPGNAHGDHHDQRN